MENADKDKGFTPAAKHLVEAGSLHEKNGQPLEERDAKIVGKVPWLLGAEAPGKPLVAAHHVLLCQEKSSAKSRFESFASFLKPAMSSRYSPHSMT